MTQRERFVANRYENLPDAVKQGLDNYRKAIPAFSTPEGVHYMRNSARDVLIGFCLAAGASLEESFKAASFAGYKGYWL